MTAAETEELGAAVLAWLNGPARLVADLQLLVEGLADRLLAAGVPIERVSTGIPLLHPQIFSSSVLWERGKPATERRWLPEMAEAMGFENSPIKLAYTEGIPIHCRIGPEPVAGEYGIVSDLRADGITDYLVLPVPFSDGSNKALTFATRAPGGFTQTQLDLLHAVVVPMSPMMEISTLKRTAVTLLETYVGRISGERVLNGAIRRGTGETIEAVIWFCDLRGFTTLSQELDQQALIDLLNAYLGTMCEAVEGHDGEILKFIGDAMLAIFPIDETTSDRTAASRAVAAARDALVRCADVNRERRANGETAFRCGIALHVGEVMYGNIGGAGRLDFTVIGPAVNLASRIESLTAETGHDVLTSAAFADIAGDALQPVGAFALKGLSGEHVVHALCSEDTETA